MSCCSGGSCSCKNTESFNYKEISAKGISFKKEKLDTFDWLSNIVSVHPSNSIVEIRFKNTRKEFFRNNLDLQLMKDDKVAVQVDGGHDIGTVSLVGALGQKQFERKHETAIDFVPKNILRKATEVDIENWLKAKQKERTTMIKSRQLANDLHLDMKIGDVEYQGDGKRAIFYYIAESRVDFRELIKVMASEFHVKIEMKQIGARQESGRIGGIGTCGRDLCCSSWKTDMQSVSSETIKIQELPNNIAKYTGQCGKLKCCLAFEVDVYIDSLKDFPDQLLELETENGILFPVKRDILNKKIWYSFEKNNGSNAIPVDLEQMHQIILENKKGIKVKLATILGQTDEPVKFQHGEYSASYSKKPKKAKSKTPILKKSKTR